MVVGESGQVWKTRRKRGRIDWMELQPSGRQKSLCGRVPGALEEKMNSSDDCCTVEGEKER